MIKRLKIGNLTIDSADAGRARDFHAALMGYDKTDTAGNPALVTRNGLTVVFAEPEFPFIRPVWPEEPGAQQKQMHIDYTVDDMQSAVDKAIGLGVSWPSMQYGDDNYITLLDTDGRPFCLCRRMETKSEFDLWYEKMGYGAIPDISINIDCKKFEALRKFYAELTDWDQTFHWTALIPENRMIVHFMGCDGDFDYVPPCASGGQQRQMIFNFVVDDLPFAVDEAVRCGALKTGERQGDRCVTLLDTEGHLFNLCEV